MRSFASRVICALLVSACTSAPKKSPPLADWLREQERTSWDLLQKNISPTEPKAAGEPAPRAGVVVAALHKKDPDYYFHWVRDSANVMRTVAEREAQWPSQPERLHKQWHDFLALSADFQRLPADYGMGEPRYTVLGQVDRLPWSRPQYDGPALRALATIRYLELFPDMPPGNRKLAESVLRCDLEFLLKVWDRRGFDLWEELFAENYHTRLVQMAALERGQRWLGNRKMSVVVKALRKQLDQHWDDKRGYLRSQLVVERTDGYTKKNTDLDSAVLVAVMESERTSGPHSLLDDRVHATVDKLENLFRTTYPLNADPQLGLAYGRYQGDVYYGGNPWPLITAYYAQFYFRLADTLARGAALPVTPRNVGFVTSLLPDHTFDETGEVIKPGSPTHRALVQACFGRGDKILARFRAHTPADGQLYEQFDKASGKPISSRGIGWAHSSLIAAAIARAQLLSESFPSSLPK